MRRCPWSRWPLSSIRWPGSSNGVSRLRMGTAADLVGQPPQQRRQQLVCWAAVVTRICPIPVAGEDDGAFVFIRGDDNWVGFLSILHIQTGVCGFHLSFYLWISKLSICKEIVNKNANPPFTIQQLQSQLTLWIEKIPCICFIKFSILFPGTTSVTITSHWTVD